MWWVSGCKSNCFVSFVDNLLITFYVTLILTCQRMPCSEQLMLIIGKDDMSHKIHTVFSGNVPSVKTFNQRLNELVAWKYH